MRQHNECGHSTDKTKYTIKKKHIRFWHFTVNPLKTGHIIVHIEKGGQEPHWAQSIE